MDKLPAMALWLGPGRISKVFVLGPNGLPLELEWVPEIGWCSFAESEGMGFRFYFESPNL